MSPPPKVQNHLTEQQSFINGTDRDGANFQSWLGRTEWAQNGKYHETSEENVSDDVPPSAMQVEHYTRKERLRIKGGSKIEFSNKSYEEIEILPDSVIYLDPPYKDTNVYDKVNGFDHDRFYAWCLRQKEPVFISEYWMPETDFKCIKEIEHNSLICATANKKVLERIFIPRHQEDSSIRQLTFY